MKKETEYSEEVLDNNDSEHAKFFMPPPAIRIDGELEDIKNIELVDDEVLSKLKENK